MLWKTKFRSDKRFQHSHGIEKLNASKWNSGTVTFQNFIKPQLSMAFQRFCTYGISQVFPGLSKGLFTAFLGFFIFFSGFPDFSGFPGQQRGFPTVFPKLFQGIFQIFQEISQLFPDTLVFKSSRICLANRFIFKR